MDSGLRRNDVWWERELRSRLVAAMGDDCLNFPAWASIPRLLRSCPFGGAEGAGSSYALRKAGDAMSAMMGIVMLAMADVRSAVSLVVKCAMVPPMVHPMGMMPMTMV